MCYKHFREEDYSLSLHRRFLLTTVIPIPFVTDYNIEIITSNAQYSSQQQHFQKETEIQHSQTVQFTTDQNMHIDAMTLLEEHSNELVQSQLKEMNINDNMQLIELENTVRQQSVFDKGNKMLEQQEKITKDVENHEHRMQNLETQMTNIRKILKDDHNCTK